MPQADQHIVTCSEEDFEYTMSVNFTAPYRLTKALIPYLQRSNSPRVINISSSMGVIGASLRGVYGLSKAMLNSLTVALSNELAGSVAVNAVAPGWVKTDLAPDGPGDPTDSARTVLRVMNLDNSISGGFFGGAGSLEFAKV
jgi:NAD(P)-dependent dehydrogenase (short-subunit alcohol dehydrogenase family)